LCKSFDYLGNNSATEDNKLTSEKDQTMTSTDTNNPANLSNDHRSSTSSSSSDDKHDNQNKSSDGEEDDELADDEEMRVC
jgi:hypothetical protein